MQPEKPRSSQLVGVFLLVLSALSLYGFISVLGPGDLPFSFLLRDLVVTIAMALGGWWLVTGTFWGYLLGLAIGGYWVWDAARDYLFWRAHGSPTMVAVWIYLAIGCVVLAGLLTPRSRHRFRGAWQARTDRSAFG